MNTRAWAGGSSPAAPATNSTYYGKIEDLVLAQEFITPAGTIRTSPLPRSATGPDIDQLLIGSEGSFGHPHRSDAENQPADATESLPLQLHVPRLLPSAVTTCREIMQSEAGFPSVFRLSDPEETEVAMSMYGLAGTSRPDTILKGLGYSAHAESALAGIG